MGNIMKSKRINGEALEMIMRDVLQGMCDFTQTACQGAQAANMEIIAVEKDSQTPPHTASILPFSPPHRK